MKLVSHLALSVSCLVFSAHALAQTTDPLWLKAVAQIEASKGFVAGEVQTRVDMTDNDGKVMETVERKSTLTGWKDGKPVRAATTVGDNKKGDSANANLDLPLADQPDQVLRGVANVQRKEEVVLDTKAAVIFQVSGERSQKDKKLPFSGRVWVDKETGSVIKLDYTFDPSNVPLTKKMSQSIAFSPTKDGVWLPKSASMDLTVSVLFSQSKVAMRYGFDAWALRP